MNDDDLVDKLYGAYGLIAQLAKAAEVMLERLGTLETTVAKLEAEAAIRKAIG